MGGKSTGPDFMNSKDDAQYRLKLASQHLEDAEKDLQFQLWRDCFSHSQECCENAGKAIIAMFKPVAATHEVQSQLKKLLDEELLPELAKSELKEALPLFGKLGLKEHILADYGDEKRYLTPWDLIDERTARKTFSLARRSLNVAKKIIKIAEKM